MIAVYKGTQYKIIKDGKRWELISKKPNSIEAGFTKGGDLFYKSIDNLTLLDDIYDMWIMVVYDTHFDKVSKQWRLEITKEFFMDNKVKLLFGEGLLPGWTVEDKNVCSKYVDISEISDAYIVKRSLVDNNERRESVRVPDLQQIIRGIFEL